MSKIDEFILGVQKNVCKVQKNKDNEFTSSKYADLEGVLNVLNPFFTEHSVQVTQTPSLQDGQWVLETVFKVGEESRSWSSPLLGLDAKNPMQALGSAITYSRRYQLKGIFKLVDSDDDANVVTPAGEPSKKARKSDIDKMFRAFAGLYVTKEEIEAHVQTDAADLTVQDLKYLKTIYSRVKAGEKKETLLAGEPTWQE